MQIQEQGLLEGDLLPLLIEPSASEKPGLDDLKVWLKDHKDWLNDRLLRHGGVLFRGFPVRSANDFGSFIRCHSAKLVRYVGGQSERTPIEADVYTSTEYPPSLTITLHNELSYLHSPPRLLYFFCQIAPEHDGETPIVDCRRVYQRMAQEHEEIFKKFESKGVLYVKNMHSQHKKGLTFGKSWEAHYETTDKKQVEDFLNEGAVHFEWKDDGGLSTREHRPGVRSHSQTGEMLWFNQANLWHISNLEEEKRTFLLRFCGEEGLPTHAYYGDGSTISEEELDRVRDVLWREAVIFPWQEGDVLFLDNFLVAHGRMSFKGKRKILVAMG